MKSDFPVLGDKLIFKGVQEYFWFTNIIANGKKLTCSKEYTLKKIDVASSWCCITLEETGDAEYSLGFFKY